MNLFITDSEGNPVFFTCNNTSIHNEINKLNKDQREKYKLTDQIKKDLLRFIDVLNCD